MFTLLYILTLEAAFAASNANPGVLEAPVALLIIVSSIMAPAYAKTDASMGYICSIMLCVAYALYMTGISRWFAYIDAIYVGAGPEIGLIMGYVMLGYVPIGFIIATFVDPLTDWQRKRNSGNQRSRAARQR